MIQGPWDRLEVKVVGVGGAGCRTISHCMRAGVRQAEFVVVDLDWACVRGSEANRKVELKGGPPAGLGSGGNVGWAFETAQVCVDMLREALSPADFMIIVAGMGGGTGSGAGPVVARVAKEIGALTVAFVTMPWSYEGPRRRRVADEEIGQFYQAADCVFVTPLDGLLEVVGRKISLERLFAAANAMLSDGIRALVELATWTSVITMDYSIMETALKDGGAGAWGIGRAQGQERGARAAQEAVSSPLLSKPLNQAGWIIFQVRGDGNVVLQEFKDAGHVIEQNAGQLSDLVGGLTIDPAAGETVTVTVMATDFALPPHCQLV